MTDQEDKFYEILSSIDTDTTHGMRDRAIIALLAGTGAQVKDLAEMRADQVSRAPEKWEVMNKAGWNIPLSEHARAILEEWVTEANITDGYLFRAILKNGEVTSARLCDGAVAAILKRRAQKVGLAGITSRDIRAVFAQNAFREGLDFGALQAILGQSRVDTTSRYILGLGFSKPGPKPGSIPAPRGVRELPASVGLCS